ncbi:MAG: potassium-transporting ATPase subunit F [Calothrix sp. SM1_7_51]|nr:potassium-transporting ATPase subunit F [Calothrix sp. SM1_7_51]
MKIIRQNKAVSLDKFLQIALEEIAEIWLQWRRQKLPLYLFLAMCFNLLVAPIVYASTGQQFSTFQAWALGLLGLTALAISTYLFFVMFVPERF